MIERPILFSAPMVIAILHGLKTQTRRVIKLQPNGQLFLKYGCWNNVNELEPWTCPYGQAGDRLWVRETFCLESSNDYSIRESLHPKDGRPVKVDYEEDYWQVPWYRATDGEPNIVSDDQVDEGDDKTRWKPSIFMPRWASRIMLEITNVRVERLNEIDNTDAIAEGVRCDCPDTPERLCAKGSEQHFKELWNKINAKRGLGWDVNPWVWAIDFKRVKP